MKTCDIATCYELIDLLNEIIAWWKEQIQKEPKQKKPDFVIMAEEMEQRLTGI